MTKVVIEHQSETFGSYTKTEELHTGDYVRILDEDDTVILQLAVSGNDQHVVIIPADFQEGTA